MGLASSNTTNRRIHSSMRNRAAEAVVVTRHSRARQQQRMSAPPTRPGMSSPRPTSTYSLSLRYRGCLCQVCFPPSSASAAGRLPVVALRVVFSPATSPATSPAGTGDSSARVQRPQRQPLPEHSSSAARVTIASSAPVRTQHATSATISSAVQTCSSGQDRSARAGAPTGDMHGVATGGCAHLHEARGASAAAVGVPPCICTCAARVGRGHTYCSRGCTVDERYQCWNS